MRVEWNFCFVSDSHLDFERKQDKSVYKTHKNPSNYKPILDNNNNYIPQNLFKLNATINSNLPVIKKNLPEIPIAISKNDSFHELQNKSLIPEQSHWTQKLSPKAHDILE